MSLLNPWTALLVAAVSIPLLLLLYFLKLRRRSVAVPSTLLWRKAVEDLQANAPFQRLRPSWLLLLQLLALVALLLALARPILGREDASIGRLILLLDVSASMRAVDGDDGRSRFDRAVRAAGQWLDEAGRADDPPEIMLIAVGRTPRVQAAFTSNPAQVRRALAALEPTGEIGRLAPALRLAEAYLGEGRDQAADARIILFSDGRFADDEPLSLKGAALEFVQVAADADPGAAPDTAANIGLTLLSAHRDYRDPAQVEVLVGVLNSASSPRRVPVRLEVEEREPMISTVEVPAAESPDDGDSAALPGEATVRFRFIDTRASLVTVRLPVEDALEIDNIAGLVLEPARRSRILVVAPNATASPYVTSVFEFLEVQDLQVVSPQYMSELEALDEATRQERLAGVELIVFDRTAPAGIPPAPTLSFGAAPPLPGVSLVETPEPAQAWRILSWDRRHPVMRDVDLDAVAIADAARLVLPETARVLALAPGGPVIAMVEHESRRHVIVAFDVGLQFTNWSVQPSFPIFIQNAVDFLTLRAQDRAGRWAHAGEPIVVRAEPGVETVRVRGPAEFTAPVDDDGTATLPPLERTGLYELEGVAPPDDRLAVNLLSPVESDLRPASRLDVGAEPTAARRVEDVRRREIWPWLVAAAIAVLAVEWLLYAARSRI